MGLCTCRKRAELFCYVHRKAICSSCILDHPTCVVGPYLDWLRDSDYEQPSCDVCSGNFDETSPTVRLTCLHIIHPSCLEHYASRLPSHTAQAGYGCPRCSKPIIPAVDDKTDLANTLRDVLEAQDWAKSFIRGDQNGSIDMSGIQSPGVNERAGNDVSGREFTIPVSRKVLSNDGENDTLEYDTDEPENKYRRRGVMQLLVALGIVTPGQGGHMLNSRRLVVAFLVISTILFVWVLFKSAGPPPPRI